MEKSCQSCAMPLSENNLGTEQNGEKSNEYCHYCYANGKFIYPNASYEDMLQKGLEGIDASEGGKLKKWVFKKSYPSLLKKCKRWS